MLRGALGLSQSLSWFSSGRAGLKGLANRARFCRQRIDEVIHKYKLYLNKLMVYRASSAKMPVSYGN